MLALEDRLQIIVSDILRIYPEATLSEATMTVSARGPYFHVAIHSPQPTACRAYGISYESPEEAYTIALSKWVNEPHPGNIIPLPQAA